MDSIVVGAYKTNQGSIPFYLFLISSMDLLHISYVIGRSDDPKKGIQRITTPERLTDIASESISDFDTRQQRSCV